MELQGVHAHDYVVLPNFPTLALLFESLFKAHNGFLGFARLHLTGGNVAPSLRTLVIDRYRHTKGVYSILPVFNSHVCTPECKPCILIQPIY